jgi:glycosyltransferase involved in cell wall biosynthesis
VTFEPDGYYQPLLQEAGAEVVVLDKRGLREATAPWRLAGIIRARRACVVHAFLFPASWRAVMAARIAGVAGVACAVRSTGVWMNRRHRMMDRATLRRARLVVANAPAVQRDILERTGLPPERVRVIFNGVDSALFHPGASPLRRAWREGGPEGPMVGFVGSLRAAKDPDLFVRIAADVARRIPAARFVVTGDGPLRAELEQRAGSLGLANGRIRFAGERADIPDVLRALDLLVVSSVREGCCNVILEAMSTGIPVVATRVGGNPDLVAEGRSGWLFPYGDSAAGADRVAGLLGDPDQARRMGREALVLAEGFSTRTMVAQTSALYEELAP